MAAQVATEPGQGAAQRAAASAASAGARLPTAYLGTMTFGWNQASSVCDDAVAQTMVQKFLASGCVEIDTARIYSAGDTEPILGRALKGSGAQGYRLATKAHPSQPGGLSEAGIRSQLEASLKALGVERVDVLYLHQPDPEHGLRESLECVHKLVQEGKVSQLGLSNYSALEVDRCCQICRENGWTAPSFYQGLYNPLNRLAEDELLPVLRKNGVGMIAFNPLAAGLLSGKHSPSGEVLGGRFKDNPNYLPRFYTEPNFQAVERIRAACAAEGLAMVPAAYAWLLRHSKLDASLGDGVLIGASSVAQLEENLGACLAPPPLPAPVVAAFDGAWDACREGAFPYWRSYSQDQPDRESLPQGASYQAKGPK